MPIKGSLMWQSRFRHFINEPLILLVLQHRMEHTRNTHILACHEVVIYQFIWKIMLLLACNIYKSFLIVPAVYLFHYLLVKDGRHIGPTQFTGDVFSKGT